MIPGDVMILFFRISRRQQRFFDNLLLLTEFIKHGHVDM